MMKHFLKKRGQLPPSPSLQCVMMINQLLTAAYCVAQP